jgi:hypothetical protein
MPERPYTEVPLVTPEHVDKAEPAPEVHIAQEHDAVDEHDTHEPRKERTGDGMGKRIVGVMLAVLVGYLIWAGYQRYRAGAASDAGAVENADTGEPARPMPSRSDDAETRPAPAPKPAPVSSGFSSGYSTVAAPASDSISPNPPNGMAFAGTGKFQVYRQGNLTWRIDTDSGSACVLFATMEEWRKPLVYQHGCPS